MNSTRNNEFYLVYGLCVAIALLSLIMFNALVILFSSISLVLAVILLNSRQIVNNFLIKRLGIIEVAGSYKLNGNLNSVSRKQDDRYKAMSVAILKPRQGSEAAPGAIKELLESISEHFEFSVELAEVSKVRIIENLRTKLRLKEIALSRVNGTQYDKVNTLKRQIDAINGDISSLASGGKSFEFIITIKSIFTSEDESEAALSSGKNIEALANKFSAALGLDYEILSGEELLNYSGV